MFMQIIQGQVRDPAKARASIDRWLRDLGPTAEGWLGSTYGITDDGMLLAAVRFESPDAARRNSERPEQSAWWKEMESQFATAPTFHDCDDVTMLLGGGSDQAGFVQVIQGHVRDRERARSLVEQSADLISKHRPDVLGATIAIDKDGFFTETVAFTSEAEAREGESRQRPPDVDQVMQEEMSLLDDVTYLDLRDPAFATHR